MHVLVAGMGNVLRGDDGFGVAVAQRLEQEGMPAGVRIFDAGIGGIHLVHELFDPTDLLIVIDAVDLARPPGTVLVIRPDVAAPAGPDDLADVHYATPERAFMLAAALGVLPEATWLVGCQPLDAERLGPGLSPTIERAIADAAREVRQLVEDFLATGAGTAQA